MEAVPAMQASCKVLAAKHELVPFCRALQAQIPVHANQVRTLLQQYLTPYRLSYGGTDTGKMTGYYEPELQGSLLQKDVYQTPLYKKPSQWDNVALTRAEIVSGKLAGKGLELVYVDDPIDAFFLQIQGSGRVRLQNGTVLRLGYDGQNGFAYTAIGKVLVDRGLLKLPVSMQDIKKWLREHPDQAENIMSTNDSYVFFKELRGAGPIGAQGVPVTGRRTVAVDPKFIGLGTLLWIDADHPEGQSPIQQLMVAQDTGGAIKGPLRADFFWGAGAEAEKYAGKMNSAVKFYMLRPRV